MTKKKTGITEEVLLKLGSKITELRNKAGYSSYETFANDYDLDRKQYWRMENGTNITINSLVKLLKIHNKSLYDFFKDFK